jgi:hypothetical protein
VAATDLLPQTLVVAADADELGLQSGGLGLEPATLGLQSGGLGLAVALQTPDLATEVGDGLFVTGHDVFEAVQKSGQFCTKKLEIENKNKLIRSVYVLGGLCSVGLITIGTSDGGINRSTNN